jgi:uncharacterized membrane protein
MQTKEQGKLRVRSREDDMKFSYRLYIVTGLFLILGAVLTLAAILILDAVYSSQTSKSITRDALIEYVPGEVVVIIVGALSLVHARHIRKMLSKIRGNTGSLPEGTGGRPRGAGGGTCPE